MNMDERRQEINRITEKIIGCVYKVSNTLGSGFLEKVYENALALELRRAGFEVKQQHGMQVRYEGIVVGDFVADLLIEEKVLIELKVVKALDDVHVAQCLNYLKATGQAICLLVNFGKPKAEVRRMVHDF
ncbi:MAG: GxxExxY protein [Deltaproteobacteria bacterium]|nr:GxxExxY protein [Deltaproteobacteria bacterium]